MTSLGLFNIKSSCININQNNYENKLDEVVEKVDELESEKDS
jgi:hypothetical protein